MNQMSKNSAKMLTFATMTTALQGAFPAVPDEEDSRAELLRYLDEFVAELGRVRPNEIAVLSVQKRQSVRLSSLADQTTMWHAYFKLAAFFRDEKVGDWQAMLRALAEQFRYVDPQDEKKTWKGDLFSRENPIWMARGVVVPTKPGKPPRVVSNRDSKQAAYLVLRDLVESFVPKRNAAMARG